jgi:hypothetical protein
MNSPSPTEAWWTIHSSALMQMLYDVRDGRSPEDVYDEAWKQCLVDNPSDN